MKSAVLACLALGLLLTPAPSRGQSQDDVTISKRRLEELERKEKELQKLQQQQQQQQLPKTNSPSQPAAAAPAPVPVPVPAAASAVVPAPALAVPASVPAPGPGLAVSNSPGPASRPVPLPTPPPVETYASPPLDSLPAAGPGVVVNAFDLANYYRADRKTADQYFHKRSFSVRGEVVGVDQKLFSRYYRVTLRSPDQSAKVQCEVFTPVKYKSLFVGNHGQQVIGLTEAESRVILLQVGDVATFAGECRGLEDSIVKMSGCAQVAVTPPAEPAR